MRVIKLEQALRWAEKQISSSKKLQLINHEKIAHTTYSIVYKLTLENGEMYLKIVPSQLFLEAKTLQFLRAQDCRHIPEILAQNEQLSCFLMKSCGSQPLRQCFDDKINIEQLKQGIVNYTKIQRKVEKQTERLLALGAHDWRVKQFSAAYLELTQDSELLLRDGLTQNEINHLQRQYPRFLQRCKSLMQYNLPETLNHCDFHDNNMLYVKQTGDINIIDWSEVAVTHPFFSLSGLLWNLKHFYHMTEKEPAYQALKQHCIRPWLDLHDKDILLKCFNIADKLDGVFAALIYAHLYRVTQNQEKSVELEHRGAIAGCLRTFLKINSEQ